MVKLLGVADLGGALGTEVNEELLSWFGRLLLWSVESFLSSLADSLCTEERKAIRRIKYLFIHYYVYIIMWVIKLLGVTDLGGALGKEVNEELLIWFGRLLLWSVGDSSSLLADS